ncbi:hypothetical protein D3C87_1364460 [compost metagenome]
MPGRNEQPILALEHEGQRKCALELLEGPRHGQLRLGAIVQFARHPQGHRFRVGLGLRQVTVLRQVGQQLAEILDDAIMDNGHALGGMGMSIGLGRRAMRRPSRVPDADMPLERLHAQLAGKVSQLALGAAPGNGATFQRGDARAVIAAIFEALQCIHQAPGHGSITDNSNNAAHLISPWLPSWRARVP